MKIELIDGAINQEAIISQTMDSFAQELQKGAYNLKHVKNSVLQASPPKGNESLCIMSQPLAASYAAEAAAGSIGGPVGGGGPPMAAAAAATARPALSRTKSACNGLNCGQICSFLHRKQSNVPFGSMYSEQADEKSMNNGSEAVGAAASTGANTVSNASCVMCQGTALKDKDLCDVCYQTTFVKCRNPDCKKKIPGDEWICMAPGCLDAMVSCCMCKLLIPRGRGIACSKECWDKYTHLRPEFVSPWVISQQTAAAASGPFPLQFAMPWVEPNRSLQQLPILTLAQLQQKDGDWVDPAKKELHLSNEEFMTVFKMTKEKFAEIPVWRQKQLKKAVKLF